MSSTLHESYLQSFGYKICSPVLPSSGCSFVHTSFASQAIDLVDEACSSVRVQLDSKPEQIDGMERQRIRLQVEEAALGKEKDPISRARLEEVRKELAALEDALRPLAIKYGQVSASEHARVHVYLRKIAEQGAARAGPLIKSKEAVLEAQGGVSGQCWHTCHSIAPHT